MSFSRAEVKKLGNEQIKQQYWSYVLASFLFLLLGGSASVGLNSEQFTDSAFWNAFIIVIGVLSLVFSIAINIFVTGPLEVGVRRLYLTGMYGHAPISLIGSGFQKEYYKKTILAVFLPKLYVALWSLLLLIPGIIKSYEYYFVSWIVAEHPGISPKEAMRMSSQITKGRKWELFVLDLSFIGWLVVGAMCCGIGTIFVMPYVDATFTQVYSRLKILEVK